MIKSLIFDFDGTIIDTETPWYYAFKDIYQEYGVDLPLELWSKCIGTSFDHFNPFQHLEQCLNQPMNREEIEIRSKEHYKKYINNVKLRDGVVHVLSEARLKGLSIAIASSSTRSWIVPYLEKHEILHYFDYIVTKDDVSQIKPNPELYVKAIELLNVKPTETIAIEDSLNGLIAAKAAGIYCVVTPNEVTKALPFEGHDLILSSLQEIGFDELITCYRK
ncbi:HAD family hydrolase [Paenibacillus spongiae]|uniref:HAD family hydrolase n=1 Tax=Paenibacillus spongiae TaxID=2909671 RepID=A0ABY5SGI2_9BACL|nr:HAD family hydrolase [Paenibacillus spongiae]UVI33112.1 HAD family hydrolase [Paenibacillus spongiae]